MAQAIKQFSGTAYNFNGFYATIYTCPANTVAIVLPTILIVPAMTGNQAAIGWNSSNTCDHRNSSGVNYGRGNILYKSMVGYEPMMITHTDKHSVRMSTGINQDTSLSPFWVYTPSFATNLWQSGHGQNEPNAGHPYDYAFKSGIVAGSNFRGASTNYALQPMDQHIGTWSMSAGHKLSLSCSSSGRIQYSFVIIEEAA